MQQKTAIAILLVVMVFSVSFVTCAAANNHFPSPALSTMPDTEGHQHLAFSVAVSIGTNLHGNATTLNQPTRLEIYNYVKSNPGVHFRGICDELDLSVGVVQYHISVLEHAGLLTSHIDGQNKRYFENNVYEAADVALISLLRHETAGKILAALSEGKGVLHRDLACSLGLSSQAITWQMNKLKDAGLVNAEKVGVNVEYTLNKANADTAKMSLYLTASRS
ncbi:MAG: winged helix-turn-helix transcriptional regulator [Candidatus Bathyarchaeota archaeon]|nr:winged helix-turn-helix transcriptional regulator [Candidatus Bathyarchaeota archaeon]